MHRLSLLLLLALPLAACDSDDLSQTATASISAPTDTTTGVTGTVDFTQDGDELEMRVTVNGLAANSTHGFHIHEVGDCGRGDHDDDGFSEVGGAARGHYDPYGTMDHGAPTDDVDSKHAGDFGNLTANASGTATATLTTDLLSLDGARPVEGRAVMVHANRDDLESDPGGMSGDRIGCGVISMATDSDDD
ncbi:superoxide dismutase family protein [Rubrivirga sp.]|uniref:superoxide dismutase family protein n=1 Tax=Rubrivirga sp. TaxID=1885344 RepID=UPI003B52C96C